MTDDKKIGKINQTTNIKDIQKTEAVQDIRKTTAVTGVSGVGNNPRKGTRVMTAEEREALFAMVSEEAEKLFGKSDITPTQREILEEAVKMTIDASIVEEEKDTK